MPQIFENFLPYAPRRAPPQFTANNNLNDYMAGVISHLVRVWMIMIITLRTIFPAPLIYFENLL
jgi:hypothetical protein